MKKEKVLSGIRPTGFLHLGNYFGAIQNYLKMQNEYECYFFVADWHSLTTHPDTSELNKSVYRVIAEYIACGLDTNKASLYIQSEIPQIAELYLYLNTLAYKGELEKTTTFKEKVRQQPQNINLGLLSYPVLQAADILIHRATKVPVGKDQEQHIEIARNLALRFNHRYQEVFPLPMAFNYSDNLIKILSLDGQGKMSKSENQFSTIFLQDEPDIIRKKIGKSLTNNGPNIKNEPMPDYIANLFLLLKLVSSPDKYNHFLQRYNQSSKNNCLIKFGQMKKELAEDMVNFLKPIQEKCKNIQDDIVSLRKQINIGTERAKVNAAETLKLVKKSMKLMY